MQIDGNLIAYLEDLSCLNLTDEEKVHLIDDLGKILKRMGQLGTLDVTGVSECSHPYDYTNSMRDDVIQSAWPRELILQNAQKHTDEMFVAPKTVD
ncbi:MAG: Asp-tRNA(Asn)/Glu-tRNA(Gln) amidotransferase subunit GatC [Oscillospiraceae bacterium]|nr:Asp-tRNA(Asn)/Glu-tRNA(Gln) amidotransferase subunit GatC [Oscillospiraceae bacterium]